MRPQLTKTKLWRLARDHGAVPPMMKRTELLVYKQTSAKLRWKGGGCELILLDQGGELHIYHPDGSIERQKLDAGELSIREIL